MALGCAQHGSQRLGCIQSSAPHTALIYSKLVWPRAGAGEVSDALAWLTAVIGLAEPARFGKLKQLCVEVAADGMDWCSDR